MVLFIKKYVFLSVFFFIAKRGTGDDVRYAVFVTRSRKWKPSIWSLRRQLIIKALMLRLVIEFFLNISLNCKLREVSLTLLLMIKVVLISERK